MNRKTQFDKRFAIDIRFDCRALSQEVHKKNPLSVLKDCVLTFREGNIDLKFFFSGDEVCLHAVDYYLHSQVACGTRVSSSVTIRLRKSFPCCLNRDRKSQCIVPPFHFVLLRMHTISSSLVFQTQFHEELNVKFLKMQG